MTELESIKYALGIILILNLYLVFNGWKKKKFKVVLKQRVNNLLMWITLVWCMYFIIFMTDLMPAINSITQKLIDESVTKGRSTEFGTVLFNLIPSVYALTIIVIIFFLIYKGTKGWIGYSSKELEDSKNERKENRLKLKTFFTKYNVPILKNMFNEKKEKVDKNNIVKLEQK